MNIIHKPLISEKMSAKSEALNQYGFIVEKTAKKVTNKRCRRTKIWCKSSIC